MSDIKKVLGENIRNHRIKLSWSQEKLSEESGLHRTYIGSVERGEKNITVTNIEKISIALNIDIKDLFNSKNDNDDQKK